MADDKLKTIERRLDAAIALTEKLLAELTGIKQALVGEHPVKDVMTYFDEQWMRVYRTGTVHYQFTDRDAGSIKRLLKVFDTATLIRRIARYLTDSDAFLVKQKHPLTLFVSRVNTYVVTTTGFTDISPGSPPSDCAHEPRCLTDARCTEKRRTELRA